jgi:tetratricopeptide (TPR) repeat protein/serine phosphatase RsbU (regulator of sigma subunit)
MKLNTFILRFLLLFIFLVTGSYNSDTLQLNIQGIVTHDGKAMNGAVINVLLHSKIESQVITGRNGRFDFSVNYGEDYIVEVSKEGFITKKIIISTKIDEDIIRAGGVTEGFFDLQIPMIEMVPGLNTSVFNKPVKKYVFDRNSWLFNSVKEVENQVNSEIEKIVNQLSVLKQKEYKRLINTADSLLGKSNYEDAWIAYENALEYSPNESYPKTQIKNINKLIKVEAFIEENYQKSIEKADYYYSNENYKLAAIFYRKASIYKPDELYPENKINDIDSIYTQIFVRKKQAYDRLISLADDYLNLGDFGKANLNFNKALGIFPNEQYPKTKIDEIDKKYEQQVSLADNLYKADNLTAAKSAYRKALTIKSDINYPKSMIDKIDKQIEQASKEAEELKEKEKELARDEEYSKFVKSADGYFKDRDFNNAMKMYKRALAVKPDEKYPENKISEINELMVRATTEESEKDRKEKEQARDEEYSNLIKKAKDLLAQEKYEEAKRLLERCSALKPDEKYPERKIGEINAILASLKEEKEQLSAIRIKEGPVIMYSDSISEENKEKINKYLKTLKEKEEAGDKTGASEVLSEIGNTYHNNNELGRAIEYYNKSLDLKKETGDREGASIVLNDIAVAFYDSGKYETAVNNYKESFKINEELGNKKISSVILDNIGQVYENTYQFEKAVDFYEQSLNIVHNLKEKEEEAIIHDKIGKIHLEQNNLEKAIESYQKSLEIDKDLNREENIAATLNNIGSVYYNLGKFDDAKNYYEQSLDVTKKIGDNKQISIALNNIGNINYDRNKFRKAIDYYKQSIEIKQGIDYKEGIAVSLHNIGNAYKGLKDYNQALEYYKRSSDLADEISYIEVTARNNRAFSEVYSLLNDYKKAYDYQKLFAEAKHTISDDKIQIFEGVSKEREEDKRALIASLRRQIQKQKLLAEYEAVRRQKEIEIKNLELINVKEKTKRQQLVIILGFIGLIALVVFSFMIYRQYIQKKKANIELIEKNRLISHQKQQITDSIRYASRIQKAVLPPEEFVTRILPQHFILNKPRDIVSGDYYWTTQREKESIIAVADCTGHGVPGAFMSMLGIAFLNEIVNKSDTAKSHEILEQLRTNVMNSLHQTGREDEAKDGMDIALIIIDLESSMLQFSGAHNPLYLIRNKKLQEVKADKMPIGISARYNKPFRNHKIQLKKEDMLYIFSDGYMDQFGGETRKKFGFRRFRELLLEIHLKPVDEQREILDNTFITWKGNYDQIDDIMVMGIRI